MREKRIMGAVEGGRDPDHRRKRQTNRDRAETETETERISSPQRIA